MFICEHIFTQTCELMCATLSTHINLQTVSDVLSSLYFLQAINWGSIKTCCLKLKDSFKVMSKKAKSEKFM